MSKIRNLLYWLYAIHIYRRDLLFSLSSRYGNIEMALPSIHMYLPSLKTLVRLLQGHVNRKSDGEGCAIISTANHQPLLNFALVISVRI